MTVCVHYKCYNRKNKNYSWVEYKMGKEAEDKAERVLSLYTRLKQGKIIYKEKESKKYRVSTRTIQRDIADVQCFLQNQYAEIGEVQEVAFDKNVGGYILRTRVNHQLEGKEILAVAKILLDSRALMKNELFPIMHKLIDACADDEEAKLVSELLKNEMYHYVELKHGKLLLQHLWQLEQAVKNQQYIEIQYKKLKKQEIIKRRIKPIGVIFSEFYFYLTAFIDDDDKKEELANYEDISPTIYRIDRFIEIQILQEHFSIPYTERFEEGEFRKRVQFMHGGKLKKVRLCCKKQALEAVLDKLPTAEVLQIKDDEYVVQAEVFGDGIDIWINGQGERIQLL